MRIPANPLLSPAVLCLVVGLAFGALGCGPKEDAPTPVAAVPAPAPAEPKPAATEPAGPVPAAAAQGATTKVVPHPAPAAAKPASPVGVTPAPIQAATPAPAPVVKPAAPAPAPAPAPVQATSPVSDPGGDVSVKATKGGLTRVGTTSCKMCHKVQFASWSETAHAKRMPPLDCESCHGSGSEYKAMATMKDPAKAQAAGLVLPGASFCATCHKRNWNDGMLKKAHAHKA